MVVNSMMDRLESFDSTDLMEFITAPKIKVMGVGGAGNNILEMLYDKRVRGVDTISLNTDAIHLNNKRAAKKTVLGATRTRGQGTGGDPHLGRICAEDDEKTLRGLVDNTDIIFIIAGMGGGTGTGCSPIIAQYARDADALVVGVGVLPFLEEGNRKRNTAIDGLEELKRACHCVIELDNEKINELKNGNIPMKKAFDVMSDLVAETVQSLSEVITEPSTINVDFADLKKIIEAGGNAKVMYGESSKSDPGSVLDAVLGNPLLGSHYQGAEAVLLHVAAGNEFALNDCHEVLSALRYELSEDVNLIWGLRTNEAMGPNVRVVMLVAAIPDSKMEVEDIKLEKTEPLGKSIHMIN